MMRQTESYPTLLSVRHLAQITGYKPKTIYQQVSRKQVPEDVVVKIGSGIRFRRSAVEQWLGIDLSTGFQSDATNDAN